MHGYFSYWDRIHVFISERCIITRALSSTKPSARCMALATCFNSCMQKRGSGPGRDRDEANV